MKKTSKKKKIAIGVTTGIVVIGVAGLVVRNSGILASGSRHPLSKPITTEESQTVFLNEAISPEQKLLTQGFPSVSAVSDPFLFGLQSDLMVNGEIVDSFTRKDPINFSNQYTEMQGVITFRGNNYRTGGTYGVADITKKQLEKKWNITTGALHKTVGDGLAAVGLDNL